MICSADSENWEKEKNVCHVQHQSIKMEINYFAKSSRSTLKGLLTLHISGALHDLTAVTKRIEYIFKRVTCQF